jgi:transcriptional regulator with XRE-family HTH domain
MTEAIGARLKELRERKNWSLREAEEHSGVSRSMLSKIERGVTSPTATVLGRIAEAFEVSISQLVGGVPTRREAVILLPRSDQPVFVVPTTGFERRSLSPLVPQGGAVDFVANFLPPGQSSGSFPAHRPGVEEILVVASGRLRLRLAEKRYDLAAGDSIYFRANVPHQFDNPSSTEPVLFYIVVNNAAG